MKLFDAFPELKNRAIINGIDSTLGLEKEGVMGRAVLLPISFGKVSWEVRGNGEVLIDSFPGLDLPDAVVASFERTKNIVTTAIAGSDGTCKEFTGWGDWLITIRGMLSSPDSFPAADIRNLRDMADVPVPLPVLCAFFEWLSIHQVVVQSISFPEAEGMNNSQPFVLTLLSDEPFEFSIRPS